MSVINKRIRWLLPKSMRHMSARQLIREHGMPAFIYYWLLNEVMVMTLTLLLHFRYLGSEDLLGLLDRCGAGRYVNLNKVEHKSWTFCNDKLVISARFLTNFAAASTFFALLTPVKLPLILATYPAFRRLLAHLRPHRKHSIHI